VHVDHFQPEAGDPLHEPGESSLIGQLSAKGCGPGPTETSQSSNSARSAVPA
jgi:hypothetical protein